jgi:hypothetical protein
MKLNLKKAKITFPLATLLPHVTTCHLQTSVVETGDDFIILMSLVSVTMLTKGWVA